MNKYDRGPHVVIVPEDDANRDLVNGFLKHQNINHRGASVLRKTGGWTKLLNNFDFNSLKTNPQRRVILLVDFDNYDKKSIAKIDQRKTEILAKIPDELRERFYLLGVYSEPEKLKSSCQMSYEKIGTTLATECADETYKLWNHELLQHNDPELARLSQDVKSFLFT
jgi:hypothetical protein